VEASADGYGGTAGGYNGDGYEGTEGEKENYGGDKYGKTDARNEEYNENDTQSLTSDGFSLLAFSTLGLASTLPLVLASVLNTTLYSINTFHLSC
jgi:hypothetical protein